MQKGMVWPFGVRFEAVGEITVGSTLIADGVGGVFDILEFPAGGPLRCGGRDWTPWMSLLEALTLCKEEGTPSEGGAVYVVVRDRRGGGVQGAVGLVGLTWSNLPRKSPRVNYLLGQRRVVWSVRGGQL